MIIRAYLPLLTAISLLLGACSHPVMVQPAPEEGAVMPISTHHTAKPQRPHIISVSPPQSLTRNKAQTVPNFSAITGNSKRKRAFFRWLTPIVAQENARILKLRAHLISLRRRTWLPHDILFLKKQAAAHKVHWRSGAAPWIHSQLLQRIDMVPVDLVLAQAAIESAWGRSRFAVEGNNLFGEWCHTAGCGMVPRQRKDGARHEVRFFTSPQLSVRAYLRNINSGKTYKLLRSLRQKERQLHQPLSGYELALGLRTYSERGMDYVRQVRHLIKSHRALMPTKAVAPSS
ncbi:MAG: glucosaminidase domain-containing protein [Mariprofundales bacterium]